MAKERKYITFFRFFFPIIFIFYFGGITFFYHTHVVNGVILVHSHPYSQEHSHTDEGLETIFFLSLIHTYGDGIPLSIIVSWMTLIGIILTPVLSDTSKQIMHGVISLRAPPFLI